ncbi:MAG TPA: PAS domain S-box protein [Cyclobacteriaceae bacterium]|nr:PAS domain S-box protein [Cyclobacteriaceae bacterium]
MKKQGKNQIDHQCTFKASPLASLLLLPDAPRFTIVDVNTAYLQATASQEEDLIGKGVFEAFPDNPEDKDADGVSKLSSSLLKVIETRAAQPMATQKYDIPVRNSNRFEERYWDPLNIPVINNKQELCYIIHTVVDVTERELERRKHLDTEALLKHSENLFKNVFDHSASGIAVIDLSGKYLDVNKSFSRITGYTKDQILKKKFQDITHPDDLEKDLLYLEKLQKGEVDYYRLEKRYITKEGSIAWVLLIVSLVKNKKGEPLYFISHIQDITVQKKIELSLKEVMQRYESLFKQNPDAVFSLDPQGYFTSANQATLNLLACSMKDILNKSFHPFLAEDEKPRVVSLFEDALKGHAQYYETRIITTNGKLIIVSVALMPILIENNITGVYGIARDITNAKELQEQVKLERDISYHIINNLPAAFFLFNRQGKFLRWNKSLENVSGYTSAEVEHMQPLDFFSEAEKELVAANIEKAFSEGGTYVEANLLTRNNELIPYYFSGSYIDYLGEACIIGFAINMQEQKNAAEEVKKSRKQFQDLVQTINGIVWEIEPQGMNFTYVSPQAEQILGYPLAQWFNNGFWESILYPEDRNYAINYCIEQTRLQKNHDFEYRMMAADGRIVWVHDLVNVVIENGAPVRLRGLMVDVTQKKNAEEAARKNQEALQNIMDQSVDIICTLDEAGKFIKVSAAVEKIWGYKPAEIEGKEFSNFIHPDDLENAIEVSREIVSGKQITNFENRYVHKNGKAVPMVWSVNWDEQEKIVYGIARDASEKKEAELKLQLSERKFKSLVQEGSDLISVIDKGGKYLYASPNSLIIKHLGPDVYLGRTAFEFIHPEDRAAMLKEFERLKTEKRIKVPPFRYRSENGEWRWIESIATNLLDDPAVQGIVVNSHDVTDKRNIEDAIKEEREQYQSLFMKAPAFICVLKGKDHVYEMANEEYLRVFGKENILGKTVTEVFPELAETGIYELLNKVFETGVPFEVKEMHGIVNRSGVMTEVWVNFTYQAYRNVKNEIEGILVFGIDVTDHVLNRKKIQESNERLELVTKATSDAVWDWDLITNQVYWGEGFKTIFGYEIESSVTDISMWTKGIHPEDKDSVNLSIENALAGTYSNWADEYRFKKANGEYVFAKDKALIIRNEQGKAIRMVGALQDVTYEKVHEESLRRLNAQLALSNQELEQFAYVVSHDMQEPLRMISSFMGLLDKKYGQLIDEQGHKYIDFAIDGAKRMRQIILDLLEFSRVGRIKEEEAEVNLNEVLDEVKTLLQRSIEIQDAKIKSDQLPVIKIAYSHVRQLFQNFLSNALKYSKEKTAPEISISVKEHNSYYEFAFTDNGIGINEKYFERIFIIFQRLHTREQYSGTGIGLALCKKIVEYYGGRIWLQSEEGKGSTFYFTLPK